VTTKNEIKNYTVGYRKPPVSGRFKSGQSGNPSGKRKPKSASTFSTFFDKTLYELVEVPEENGKTALLTRKHRSVRTRMLAAAKGKLPPLRDLLKLRETVEKDDPVATNYAFVDLEELKVCGPIEEQIHGPNVVLVREPKPSDSGDGIRTKAATTRSNSPERPRFIKRGTYTGPQTFRALAEYEFERQLWVTDSATGQRKRMSMRALIVEQLMRAFEMGKPGTLALLTKLNERSPAEVDRRLRVRIPWDYQIPPPPPGS